LRRVHLLSRLSATRLMKTYESPWMDDDLRMLRASISRFVEAKMLPLDARWRQQHHVDKAMWRKVGEAGFLCMDIPAEYGGGGGDFRHEALLYEELNRRGISGFGQGVHSIAAHYLLNHGTEQQKQRWLPRMARGELIGAIGMTEPGTGSDLKGIRTRAVRAGDHYVINGSKIFITNGGSAGILMLVVRTDPNDRGGGLSILMVETEGLQGYRVGRVLDKMGVQAQDTAELFFEDVRVPTDCLLLREGKGMHMLMGDLPYERLLIAVVGVAAMEGAIGETIKYVNERKIFGQAVMSFQNTKFKLAECATHARVARVFVDRCIEELVRGELAPETAAMAKWWVTDMQQQVIDECQQLFGGYGYMNEYLVCRLFADARVQRIYGGTNEVMKELISRSL
jgi:acyl-CoA dehydrogenase